MKNFKEWLNLNEGVSVYVKNLRNKEEAKDLLELTHELSNALHYQYNHPVGFRNIEVDGDDHFETKGLINFYLGHFGSDNYGDGDIIKDKKGLTTQNINKVIYDTISYLNQKGIKTGKPQYSTWADYYKIQSQKFGIKQAKLSIQGHENNLNQLRVVRLPVELNLQLIKNADMPPEINMGFDTAKAVFDGIYGLGSGGSNPLNALMGKHTEDEGEWTGWEFTPDQIIKTYERLDNKDKQLYAGLTAKPDSILKTGDKEPGDEPWSEPQIYKGPTIFQGGINPQTVLTRARQIYDLAKWAKSRGYSKLYTD